MLNHDKDVSAERKIIFVFGGIKVLLLLKKSKYLFEVSFISPKWIYILSYPFSGVNVE